ncbi:MAG: hypothetical protein CME70_13530 [Halobacteriovorax sp.]|nr:hypothetical protein [Halobacteriovorax sp.]|tara:strand:- start:15016 stop:16524 length:1509 start_codon:yes stop_codon:yes gene_type:complete
MVHENPYKLASSVLLAAFVFLVALIFYHQHFELCHHEYLRIIEQNIKGCTSFACYRDAQMAAHQKGYLLIRYIIFKLAGDHLNSSWISISLMTSLFFGSLLYVLQDLKLEAKKILLIFVGMFLAWPILHHQILTGEDNLSYYGLFLLFIHWFLNKDKTGIVSGSLLGVLIFLHGSPLVFLGLGSMLLLGKTNMTHKSAWVIKFIFSALLVFHLFHFALYFDVFLKTPLDLILDINPINEELSGFASLEQLKFTLNDHTSEQGGVIHYLGLLWSGLYYLFNLKTGQDWIVYGTVLFFFILVLNTVKNCIKERELNSIFLLIFSTIPVLLYRPSGFERWDFFILILSYLIFSKSDLTKGKFNKVLILVFIIFQSINLSYFYFSKSKLEVRQTEMLQKFKNEIKNIPKNRDIVFGSEYLVLDPIIMVHFPKQEQRIYFYEGSSKSMYQTKLSRAASRATLRREDFDDWKVFSHWRGPFLNEKLQDVVKVGFDCDATVIRIGESCH